MEKIVGKPACQSIELSDMQKDIAGKELKQMMRKITRLAPALMH
jgi:hypothetical protein